MELINSIQDHYFYEPRANKKIYCRSDFWWQRLCSLFYIKNNPIILLKKNRKEITRRKVVIRFVTNEIRGIINSFQ